ncbi:CD225/dispanin family protein [Cellulomonas sp. URHD0024]|uniref:CD225/dispanin family protein n=1 Tax=Cellulomonas sp. URHD0024 TaxID=1302620 RepID=UPI000415EE22|nr:CD225/dispanin family protein [Cellulomonas sp. URHD0024]
MARESDPATDPTEIVDPPAVADPPAYVTPPPASPPPAGPPAGFATPSALPPGRTSAPVGWVIAAMLLFWPTGIPALLASHRAARAFGAGDVAVALQESANSRRWSIISVIVGGVLIAMSFLATIAWAFVIAVAVHDHGDTRFERGPAFGNEKPFLGPDQKQFHGPDGRGLRRSEG